MPRRDPRTGKFVSGSSAESIHTYSGAVDYTIPAADLAGGTGTANVDGEEAELIDFTQFLDSDEVFECWWLEAVVTVGAPTTATAESSVFASYSIRTDHNDGTPVYPSFYFGSSQDSQGIIDIRRKDRHDDSSLLAGVMMVENSHSDTTNGLAGGAENETQRHHIDFRGLQDQGPGFDADDEATFPVAFGYDNISDHAIVLNAVVQMHGPVHDLD